MRALYIFLIPIMVSFCFSNQDVSPASGANVCTQSRSYTLDVGSANNTNDMATAPADFEILYIPTDFNISNSNCAGLPNQSSSASNKPKFNAKRVGQSLFISSVADSNFNMTILFTNPTATTIPAQDFTFTNSYCKTDIKGLTGTATYSATASSRQIAFSYSSTITNIDNCSAF